jgi:hypothetical protein
MPFPNASNERLTLSLRRATVVRWRLAILQSLIGGYPSGGVFLDSLSISTVAPFNLARDATIQSDGRFASVTAGRGHVGF